MNRNHSNIRPRRFSQHIPLTFHVFGICNTECGSGGRAAFSIGTRHGVPPTTGASHLCDGNFPVCGEQSSRSLFNTVSRCPSFQAADIARDPTNNLERAPTFRPQTMAAAMQLLRFVLNEVGYTTKMDVLNSSDHLDTPTSVIIRWGIVPQWTWSIWLEYRSLHADTIMRLVRSFSFVNKHALGLQTTAYIQHHSAGPGPLLEVSDLMPTNSRSSDQAAVISVVIVRR